MSERSWSFNWTWIINWYSILFLTTGLSSWLDILIENTHRAGQVRTFVWVGFAAVTLGLWLYLRKRGGWQVIEPPPEVFLFWFLITILVMAVSILAL
jgi:hypothetical protein